MTLFFDQLINLILSYAEASLKKRAPIGLFFYFVMIQLT